MTVRLFRRNVVRHIWDRLETSFWFTPLVMAVGAVLLAFAIYWIDRQIPNEVLQSTPLIVSGSVTELRSFLGGMATTSLATAGVVFTLLTLPLSTVAAQYGSRLLRVFQGDRTTQLVLGMFVSTFVYCATALTLIPPADLQPASPQLTATFGFVLFLATFASLILLVQHFATMLQAPNVAAAAGEELLEVVHEDIQAVIGGGTRREACGNLPAFLTAEAGRPIRLASTGYIKYIDPEPLLALAGERDLVIRLLLKTGHFVSSGAVVAEAWPAERIDADAEREIRDAFNLGRQRTPTQDIEYAFNQLAEMAIRAMSPAINDPFTAITCLDYMGEGLAIFVRERIECPYLFDRDGALRIVVDPVSFEQVIAAAFGMLRHAANNNAAVMQHMLDVVDEVARETESPAARGHLADQVSLIRAESRAGALIERDREAIARRCDKLEAQLRGSPR
jgi:uncharacterized membrane protein